MKNFLGSMHPLLKKVLFLLALMLILEIPLRFLSSVVYKRDYLYRNTVTNIGNEWGENQTIAGPAIVAVYERSERKYKTERIDGKDKETYSIVVNEYKYIILPDDLDIKAKLNDEIRARGIYKSNVYTSNLNMIGSFSNLHNKIEDSKDGMKLKNLYIFVGVSNTNSLEKINKFTVGEKSIVLESGTGLGYPIEFGKGVAGNLDIYEDTRAKILKFDINFDLRGSEEISMLPLGRNNYFEISSSWKSPSFIGTLPGSKTINESGFIAKWNISHLTRDYRQEFYGNSGALQTISDGHAGVFLYPGVTHYRQIIRAIKYGILFIMLSLGIVCIFEISSKKETHYIQYGVVGISLTLFYLVLLSFSEHMSFGGAYVLATVAMAIPNALYMKSITKSVKYGIGMFVFLVAIYSILFSILQMEEYALITGVLLVLFILYVIMYLTRNLDNIEY